MIKLVGVDPIVVLGSRVRRGRPGVVLEERLRAAMNVAVPGQTFIVSGKGEAPAMRRYLEEYGISGIIEDNEATSTNENLENAWRLAGGKGCLVVVTSNFHVLRTRLWAWHLGIPVRVVSAPTPCGERWANYMRELFATPHSAVRILYRRFRSWKDRT